VTAKKKRGRPKKIVPSEAYGIESQEETQSHSTTQNHRDKTRDDCLNRGGGDMY